MVAVVTAEMHHPLQHCSHPQSGVHKCSASTDEFFPHTGIQFHTFASYTFPCQAPFCQTAPLLPSGTQQQNVMEYWWEGSTSTATLPTSTSDIMGQHNKIGGSTFGGALKNAYLTCISNKTYFNC